MKFTNVFTLNTAFDVSIKNTVIVNDNTGQVTQTTIPRGDSCSVKLSYQDNREIQYVRVSDNFQYSSCRLFFYRANGAFISSSTVNQGGTAMCPLGCTSFIVKLYNISENITISNFAECGKVAKPIYSKLRKTYKKESEQKFYRESLDGSLTFIHDDFEFIVKSSIHDKLCINLYRNGTLYSTQEFYKTDCTIDFSNHSCTVKPKSNDNYTQILNGYDKKYNLAKIGTKTTRIKYHKRTLVQLYVAGENTVSNYFGGTYYEEDVTEPVSNLNELKDRYSFNRIAGFSELSLEGFNYQELNTTIPQDESSQYWNFRARNVSLGTWCNISFIKTINAGALASNPPASNHNYLMSTGKSGASNYSDVFLYSQQPDGSWQYTYKYDMYKICIYIGGTNGTGTLLYESQNLYAKNSGYRIVTGTGLYPMNAKRQTFPQQQPQPQTFNFGEQAISYDICGRIICSSDDPCLNLLSKDDFAFSDNRNFNRRYYFLMNVNYPVVDIRMSSRVSLEPTEYGHNDYDEYFMPPYEQSTYDPNQLKYWVPLAKSSWGNSSLWVHFNDDNPNIPYFYVNSRYITTVTGHEADCYKETTLKDAILVSDAISSLLKESGSLVTHEATPEYSEFLYGTADTHSILGGCNIYITQITNILKSEYDQAAQKAEISLKTILDMLATCFKVYWFVEDNKLKLEQASFFDNFSYSSSSSTQIDLTKAYDASNSRCVLYGQSKVSYAKPEMTSRYEFSWSGDTTDAMGQGLVLDVLSKYIQAEKVDTISPDNFNADLDFMLFNPSSFSEDSFALILADKTDNTVRIARQTIYDRSQPESTGKIVYTQNYESSFNNLIRAYMFDLPSDEISCNYLPSLQPIGLAKTMEHTVEFMPTVEPVLNELIHTDIGNGEISEMSIDIDSGFASVKLQYEPY